MRYELEERVEKYGEVIIDLVKKIKINYINRSIIDQLIRSSTSIGANYYEANSSSSKKDFINKVAIAKKEANETQHWLRMLIRTDNDIKNELNILKDEAHQLGMIFSSIISKVRNKI